MPDGLPPVVQVIAQFASSEVERLMKRAVLCCCLFVALLGTAVPLPAQVPAASPPAAASSPQSSPEASKESNDRLAQLERRVVAAQSAGDNAWMLTSAALVLMMTGPGLALFYGGLVRRKNTLAIMMQSFAMMGLITVLWALVGYSLAFGGDGKFIGDFSHLLLRGVGASANADYSATIPELTFMVYQLMF